MYYHAILDTFYFHKYFNMLNMKKMREKLVNKVNIKEKCCNCSDYLFVLLWNCCYNINKSWLTWKAILARNFAFDSGKNILRSINLFYRLKIQRTSLSLSLSLSSYLLRLTSFPCWCAWINWFTISVTVMTISSSRDEPGTIAGYMKRSMHRLVIMLNLFNKTFQLK